MRKLMKTSAVALLCAVTTPAMARDFPDIYTECGLGAMIAPKNTAVAAITNVTWDLGTTAISSNVSSPETCKGGKAKTAALILDSYDQLASDIASGSGDYLNTLISVSEVRQEERAEFVNNLRSDFAKLVAAPGYAEQTQFERSEALFNAIYKNS